MKKFSLFALALVAAFFFSPGSIGSAKALAPVDPVPSLFTDGTEYRLPTDRSPTNIGSTRYNSYGEIFSSLDSNTKLTITYSISKTGGYLKLDDDDVVGADGAFLSGSNTSFEIAPMQTGVTTSFRNDYYHYSIILTLINLGAEAAEFKTYIMSTLNNLQVSAYVRAEAVAAVPLPAALPLFGLGLAGLAGYKRARRKA